MAFAPDHPDKHPIEVARQDLTLEQRIAFLEEYVARHHDQLWWMQLQPRQREHYEQQGFRAPIQHFYGPGA
jgi:hypothetical protein